MWKPPVCGFLSLHCSVGVCQWRRTKASVLLEPIDLATVVATLVSIFCYLGGYSHREPVFVAGKNVDPRFNFLKKWKCYHLCLVLPGSGIYQICDGFHMVISVFMCGDTSLDRVSATGSRLRVPSRHQCQVCDKARNMLIRSVGTWSCRGCAFSSQTNIHGHDDVHAYFGNLVCYADPGWKCSPGQQELSCCGNYWCLCVCHERPKKMGQEVHFQFNTLWDHCDCVIVSILWKGNIH